MAKTKKRHTNICFDLAEIKPLTNNQKLVFNSNKNLVMTGSAGTGKSFLSCFLAFDDMFITRRYKKLIIVRSAVPTRDIGFLPGDDKEKSKIYETPYVEICSDLLGRGDAYEILKRTGKVEFMTTSFLRGITISDCYLVIDECQNMTLHELDSIVTRVGRNCRIIFSGDTRQGDLKRDSGLNDFIRILDEMDQDFDIIDFTTDDIVRSSFVKRYLQTRERMAV